MNTIEKLKTFLTSRRAWVTAMFLAYVAGYFLPFVEEYLGVSVDLVKDLPAEERAEALAALSLSILGIAVTVAGVVYLPVRNLVQEWTVRPPKMEDAFAVFEIIEEGVEVLKEEVADLTDDGKLNDSNKVVK